MYILWVYTQNDKKKSEREKKKMTVYDLLRLDENYATKEAKIAQKKEAAAAAA